MDNNLELNKEYPEETGKRKYEEPKMTEHEPLEESTAYVYYYYTW